MKILLLEDDVILSEAISEFLIDEGFDVVLAYDGFEAEEIVLNQKFDLLLLDVNVPNLDGFELLKSLRELKNLTPTIFITALNSLEDMKRGFNLGANDYIKKPFDLEELKLRIENIKRIYNIDSEKLKIDENIYLDIKNSLLFIDSDSKLLRDKEVKILKYFLENRGRVISSDELVNNIWSFNESPTNATIRTYIKNLRVALGDGEFITTIKGLGYRFD